MKQMKRSNKQTNVCGLNEPTITAKITTTKIVLKTTTAEAAAVAVAIRNQLYRRNHN